MQEPLTFLVFVTLQYLVRMLPHWIDSHPRLQVWIARIGRHHWAVWLVHPVVWHGAHEYLVHFIVYSGFVIRSH